MINVNITQEMIEKCYRFSSQIILGDNQFDRLPATLDVRVERTFVGKLAEYVFLNYLRSEGIYYDEGDMFEIFEGQQNVDGYDFKTKDGEKIDIKSASRTDHHMIMAPIDQFIRMPKDYYVGIKINTGVNKDTPIPIDNIKTATIYGYCTYKYLAGKPTKNYTPKENREQREFIDPNTGEIVRFTTGDCKFAQLQRLLDIQTLIKRFK